MSTFAVLVRPKRLGHVERETQAERLHSEAKRDAKRYTGQ